MPSGTPSSRRAEDGHERQFQRRRQAREDQLQHRHIEEKRAAEIARQRAVSRKFQYCCQSG